MFLKNKNYSTKSNRNGNKILSPELRKHLKDLRKRSISQWETMIQRGECLGTSDERKVIEDGISFMEEALKFYGENLEVVAQLLMVLFIVPLPLDKRGFYGEFSYIEIDNGELYGIYLTPTPRGNGILTSQECARLNFWHEIGHAINRLWMEDAIENIESISFSKRKKNLYISALEALDETTTQERAEDVAYSFANKQRPAFRKINFCGYELKSNFNFYYPLQETVGRFAQTVKGMSNLTWSEALNYLSQQALSSDFFFDILEEHEGTDDLSDFFTLISYLGNIKKAVYAEMGVGEKPFRMKSKLKKFFRLCEKHRNLGF